MLVSDLVNFRNSLMTKLTSLDENLIIKNYHDVLKSVIYENTQVQLSIHDKINQVLADFILLQEQSVILKNNLLNSIDDVNLAIDELAKINLIKQDDTPYKNYYKIDYSLDPGIDQIIKSKIHKYADWHFPGLQLGCLSATRSYTTELVANDPLYLCDLHAENMDNISSMFNDTYNKRIRKYVIKDHNLAVLPHNQFGFILCWMFFNFTGIDLIKSYLDSLIKILRPGGTMMFSYNNADLVNSCQLAERNGMSFAPGRKIIEFCNQIGFEIVDQYDLVNTDTDVKYVSWITVKKSGVLTTIKRSQAKGQILTK